MKKKVFRQMALLSSFGILIVSAVLCGFFYSRMANQVRADLWERTHIFANDNYRSALDNLTLVEPGDMRITVVSADGAVLFDNMVSSEGLERHLDREEIEEALTLGTGESRRFSDTLGMKTYYYAIRLTDGSVLRTAKTISSIWRMFADALPATAAMIALFIIIGYYASKRLARRVVEPISRMDLSGEPSVPYDELAPFARAIADQRRQIRQGSEELRDRTDTINAILDNMAEGVVVLDRQGAILSINKSAAAIFNAKEPMGERSPLELLRDPDFHVKIRQALKGRGGEMNFHKAGREYRILLSPVAETGVVVLFLDTTEKSLAEIMRREFSANVSHELKTPLTSIYGNAEMLMAGVVRDEDKMLFYGKIKDEASRLMILIEDIIMLSELDEGKSSRTPEDVSLQEVAKECAEALAHKAAEHQVAIGVRGAGTLRANRSMIYEIFYNLMDNGIKYNRPGGQVETVISQEEGKTTIAVSDTGIGISAADRHRIFERFYRADKSRSKMSGGTGLGLAIVKHVVMLYGGAIQVADNPGGGTRFEITF